MDVRVGDLLTMKKPHPCGAREFLVLRSGMDFRIRCTGCGREVMVPRARAEKNIRRITRDGDALQARPGSVTDCVGRYTVELGGRCYDTDLLVGIFHDGPLTEQYIDARGRTVLWRRFNRDDWALERYGETWSQRFPENQRITVNGVLYVHWYDCISRDILG